MWNSFTVLVLEKHIPIHVKQFMLSSFLIQESHTLKPLNVYLWFLVFTKIQDIFIFSLREHYMDNWLRAWYLFMCKRNGSDQMTSKIPSSFLTFYHSMRDP